ncbi:DEAD/DEAH box helicase [Enterorhabdus mucosicola]|uniref:DEAD/DEAH box helicase n=1 Tax=Adlercreutzia mucosicola TaxID=580026 RepID=A0A6N8JSF1_9ACTN|nr:DEAD/DEAH box helicase [Adlercreutzia mucosicola]MVX61829.1 DEAD/DEAH box helicase [Adlercreutzia mucosicola]
MTTFADLGLSDSVLAAVDKLGYTEPTPVQAQSIPLALEGRDMIAAAKTGTGKTAAFSLPSLDRLQRADRKKAPAMLVITPTRELAMQIQEVCGVIAKSRGLRVANVVGGVKIEPQIDRLARGVDVLIATPGRLIDLMNQKAVDLSQVQILVLDEADRMLDMGFLPSVRRIVEATPATRQTLLFSATIDKGVLSQVDTMLNDPAIVQIAAKGETADTVDQYIARVPHTLKPDLLAALLKERGAKRVIVFARTRHRADAACRKLKRAGYHAEAIHSDRSQNQRKRALDNFAAGTTDILVATDVLARGIDVDEVSYVVNYDVPVQAEDYVHRIGRTGRAGAEGFAVTFVAPENKPELAAIEKLIKRPIPEIEVPGFNLEEAAEAAAARATRANAKHDPELAAAAREHAKKEKHRAKEKARAEEDATEERQRSTRKKKAAKNSGAAPTAGRAGSRAGAGSRPAAKGAPRSGAGRSKKAHGAGNAGGGRKGPDLRPGRAHRAAVAAKRGGRKG